MTINTSVLYEPRGKAREYAPLAVNLYSGCGHRCVYCYAPAFVHTSKDVFANPKPRANVVEKLEGDLKKLPSEYKRLSVLLCFTCDPYQPVNEQFQLTRKAVKLLHENDMNVMLLTKGGRRAETDFDLLHDNDWFGVTLTHLDDAVSLQWEPGAALPLERIETIHLAHRKGIKTWVSLEPVLYPDMTLEIIRRTHRFVDEFKVGTLNYHPHLKNVNWRGFAKDVKRLLVELDCRYYLKEDLRKWL